MPSEDCNTSPENRLASDEQTGRNPRLSFSRLSEIESRLADLEIAIKAIRDDSNMSTFCANHRWIGCAGCTTCGGGLKRKLTRLVGWQAEIDELRNSDAYDVAYDHLYSLLPPCRNCSCL
jgi:hypothetical protein